MSAQDAPADGPQAPHYALITEDLVKNCLKSDKGKDAVLQSYEVKDFTKKGDNYMSVVTSVLVHYRKGGKDLDVSYVVKLNPQRSFAAMSNALTEIFTKESGFYADVCPVLNKQLRLAGLPDLRVAKCPFTHLKRGEEALFMEDLRARAFKMVDRREGLDEKHCVLLLKELARLHGSSILYKEKENVVLLEKFPFLIDFWLREEYSRDHPEEEASMNKLFAQCIESTIQVASQVGGYDKLVDYLKSIKDTATDIFKDEVKNKEPYLAVGHGDCWVNNVLFRYDKRGNPVEVMLVDLQIVRSASPTIDLNYLFYTSLAGADRQKNLDKYLESYYSSLKDVLRAGGVEVPFSLEELKCDYKSHNMFGFLSAMFILPIILSESGETFDIDHMNDDNMDEKMQESRLHLLKMMANPVIESRFLRLFDEMDKYISK
ncbi:uncharacterized protein LOC143040008 [Oratosquilla oratoria]|uniref:uncharacterized protein LOC143040008 n=1 Tax=Oratosquilla oratoria TaxID=337810 RepID=UPI003F76F1D7